MDRICINSRDELLVLNLNKVACFRADVDYTTVYYVSGLTTTITMGLNKVERIIATIPKSPQCDFVRVGRSYIVNQIYLFQIQTLRQRLVLCDGHKAISLSVSKEALKRYKQYIAEKYGSPINPPISP